MRFGKATRQQDDLYFVVKYPNREKQVLRSDDLTGSALKAAIEYLEERIELKYNGPDNENKFPPEDRPIYVSILSVYF